MTGELGTEAEDWEFGERDNLSLLGPLDLASSARSNKGKPAALGLIAVESATGEVWCRFGAKLSNTRFRSFSECGLLM
jgi:hypothetical protein